MTDAELEIMDDIAAANGERDFWNDYCKREKLCRPCCGNGFFSTGAAWPMDTRDCPHCEGTGRSTDMGEDDRG